jgi:ACS family hexuronate transporter-like MFS transporter
LYLFWLPDFFSRTYGLSLLQLGPPIIVIYLMADVGSVGGGWLSSTLINRGWSRQRGAQNRRCSPCAVAVVPIVAAASVQSHVVGSRADQPGHCRASRLVGERVHLVSDTFPRRVVGSVVGLGGLPARSAG